MRTEKHPKNKLLLFDVDGTLLSGRGVPRAVFLEVVHRRFPDYTETADFSFSGMTDPKIVQKMLAAYLQPEGDSTPFIETFLQEFLNELEKRVTPQSPPLVLAGVRPLLDFCEQDKYCFLGLVTGNMQRGADIKLKAGRLKRYFPIGAYGSDHEERNLLPPLAIQRAQAYYGRSFSRENIWIVGDSIYDVRCAKANELRSLAVASGVTAMEILAAEKPDILLPDLRDTEKLAALWGLNKNY